MAIDLKGVREIMRPGLEARAKAFWDYVGAHVDISKLTHEQMLDLFFMSINYTAFPFIKLGPGGEVLEIRNGNSVVMSKRLDEAKL